MGLLFIVSHVLRYEDEVLTVALQQHSDMRILQSGQQFRKCAFNREIYCNL